MKKCCEKCIHSRQDWYSERNDMVKCEKRKKSVNKGGFICRCYAEVPWWKKVWVKRFFRGE